MRAPSGLSSVNIVASPRPRVGKTLLARLLTDFHLREGRSVAAFDLNVGKNTLAQYLPEQVTRSAIDDLQGQMALFDRLTADDGTTKIVDLSHASFEAFFTLAHRFGFGGETRSRGIALVIHYLLAPDYTSVDAYHSLQMQFLEAVVTPVHNEIFGVRQHREGYKLTCGPMAIRLPLLAPAVHKYVEVPPFSFTDLPPPAEDSVENSDITIELEHWLRRIHLEFRELYLRILLTDLKSSIRL
jgi:hypothetical protein